MEWRIFFISPTGSEEPIKNPSESVDHGPYLPTLHAHIVDYLMSRKHGYTSENGGSLSEDERREGAALKKGEEKITTLTSEALYRSGATPENVFDAIDDSDLVIADLSGNRPRVIYELAFAHALGIRTIVASIPQKASFYFSHIRFAEVEIRDEKLSSPVLNGLIDRWLKDKNKRFDSPNPLTNFYGAPLPDISAATGLAAGFYENFARPILSSGKIVERMPDGSEEVRELKGFIVLNPEGFNRRINTIEKNLWDVLSGEFPDEVKRGKQDELVIQTNEGERIPHFLVKDYVIDIPRTMFSLALSPRLKRTNRSKKEKSLRDNMETVLIERFFEAVKVFLKSNGEVEKEKFYYGSIKEIPRIIETGKSETWAE